MINGVHCQLLISNFVFFDSVFSMVGAVLCVMFCYFSVACVYRIVLFRLVASTSVFACV